MDALQIFPALLALMIATLAALGYALHRIEQPLNQPTASSLQIRQCSQCGRPLAVDWRHCPACGLSLQSPSPFAGTAHHSAEGSGS